MLISLKYRSSNMMTVLLIAFLLIMGWRIINGDSNFIYFSRFVTWVNSFKKSAPSELIVLDRMVVAEYTIEEKTYGVLIRKHPGVRKWIAVGAEIGDDEWIDVTKQINYFAGLYYDFHLMAIKPSHIDERYRKLSFRYDADTIIHIGADQVISTTLTACLSAV